MFSKLRLINEHRFGMQGVFMGQLVLYNKNQIGTKTYWFFFIIVMMSVTSLRCSNP